MTVTVSSGPEKIKLPDNLQGQSEAYVRNALKDLGLVDGTCLHRGERFGACRYGG